MICSIYCVVNLAFQRYAERLIIIEYSCAGHVNYNKVFYACNACCVILLEETFTTFEDHEARTTHANKCRTLMELRLTSMFDILYSTFPLSLFVLVTEERVSLGETPIKINDSSLYTSITLDTKFSEIVHTRMHADCHYDLTFPVPRNCHQTWMTFTVHVVPLL